MSEPLVSPTPSAFDWFKPAGAYERWGKRALDLALGIPAALAAAPIVALAAIAIKFESQGSVFFRQARVGREGSEFALYKLRTMRTGNRASDQVFKGHPDVTRVGAILRRWKLDELPQLFNVLKGDMSLVGPRPCLPATAAQADENGRYRFMVRPGLTGHAQTRGNIALTWQERWKLDREYIEGYCLQRDLGLLIKTVAVIILGEHRWVRS